MPHFIYLLRQHFADEVHVILSKAAQAFVTPYTFRLFSGHWAFSEETEMADGIRVPHIDLPKQADVFLVMPATANVLAKAAHGIGDDLVTTSLLACEKPVVFVPSMNDVMWRHRAVRENVRKIRALGYHVVAPAVGYEVSNGRKGYGGMAPFEQVLGVLERVVARVALQAPRRPATKRTSRKR